MAYLAAMRLALVDDQAGNLHIASFMHRGCRFVTIGASIATYRPGWGYITPMRTGDVGKTSVASGKSETRRAVRWRRREKSPRCPR